MVKTGDRGKALVALQVPFTRDPLNHNSRTESSDEVQVDCLLADLPSSQIAQSDLCVRPSLVFLPYVFCICIALPKLKPRLLLSRGTMG